MHERDDQTLSYRWWGSRHGVVDWIEHTAAILRGTVGGNCMI